MLRRLQGVKSRWEGMPVQGRPGFVWQRVGGTAPAPSLLARRVRPFKGKHPAEAVARPFPVIRWGPSLLGESTAEEESRLFKALHAAAVAKYQATHGPQADPARAADLAAQMETLSRAYLALGKTADELERAKSTSFLDRLGDAAGTVTTVALVGGAIWLGITLLSLRPARRMDF